MQNKHLFFRLSRLAAVLFAIFSFVAFNVSAQEIVKTEGTTKYYRIENTEEGEPEFIQTLTWLKQEDVIYYDAYIEKKDDSGMFKEIQKIEKIESNSVDVKLKPGYYRYYVIAYNLLEEPEIRSENLNFEILLAIQPEVDSVSPKLIYLEEINDGYFTLSGKNFLPASTFGLRLYNKGENANYITSSPFIGTPKLNAHGTRAEITYSQNKLAPGEYQFTVENPGGLSSYQDVVIKYRKPMDLDVSIGYHPAYIVRDDTIPNYFDTHMVTLGLGAKLTWIPFKKRTGFYGIGINPSVYHLEASQDAYKITTEILTAQLNLVYQYPVIKNHLTFELHAGAGVLMLKDMKFEFKNGNSSEPLNSSYYAVDAGIAFQIYVHKHTYVEIQGEYVSAIDSDFALDLASPSISIGHQF